MSNVFFWLWSKTEVAKGGKKHEKCTAATWSSLLVNIAMYSHRGISCLKQSIFLLFEYTLRHFVPESAQWEESRRLQADSFWLASPSERSELPECSCSLKSLCPQEHNAGVCLARRPSLPVMQYSWQHTHISFEESAHECLPKSSCDLTFFIMLLCEPPAFKGLGRGILWLVLQIQVWNCCWGAGGESIKYTNSRSALWLSLLWLLCWTAQHVWQMSW